MTGDVPGTEPELTGERLNWVFTGRVLPERVPVTISIPGTGFALSDAKAVFNMDVHLHQSQIVVKIDAPADFTDTFSLRNIVEAFAREIVDFIGYSMGVSFDVEIVSSTNSLGDWTVYGINIPVVSANRQGMLNAIESADLGTILNDNGARIALADFREAMKMPGQTGFFCYRAIEAMMQTLRKESAKGDEGRAWEALRGNLNISRASIDVVKAHSDWARHGQSGSISDEERARIFKITDEILGRYLDFILRGRSALPLPQYPMFDGDPDLATAKASLQGRPWRA